MQFVRSSAGVGDTNVEALYFLAIASARERLHLTAAYFAPRPAFIEALLDAADRGVHVRVLVPGPHIDKGFVRVAGRGVYDELLACGVRIFEYQPTMLHAKTLTVDGAGSSIGSVNFDNRSFQLQDEATLCVCRRRSPRSSTRSSSATSTARRRSTPSAGATGRSRSGRARLKLARREL